MVVAMGRAYLTSGEIRTSYFLNKVDFYLLHIQACSDLFLTDYFLIGV